MFMSRRSEHGGGEAAIQREAMEAYAYNNEKRDRKLARTAMHEIDRIIQEENENCPIQQTEQEQDVLPEL
jgi:hypothetical protein